ncbi:hypothetical protein MNBD_ALPHA04-1910 [hydrothermal vent metagenome]|uniref:Uncharacterized protein n=1 Tax=hydrothermal vent metagenome TaxID=652676 RepID=A0A3B0T7R8_9ZZZZ
MNSNTIVVARNEVTRQSRATSLLLDCFAMLAMTNICLMGIAFKQVQDDDLLGAP